MPTSEDKICIVACHLGWLVGLPIIVPILIMVLKKDSELVSAHARQAVVAHLACFVLTAALVMLGLFTFGLGLFVAIPAIGALTIALIVFSIIATLRGVEGQPYEYPLVGHYAQKLG